MGDPAVQPGPADHAGRVARRPRRAAPARGHHDRARRRGSAGPRRLVDLAVPGYRSPAHRWHRPGRARAAGTGADRASPSEGRGLGGCGEGAIRPAHVHRGRTAGDVPAARNRRHRRPRHRRARAGARLRRLVHPRAGHHPHRRARGRGTGRRRAVQRGVHQDDPRGFTLMGEPMPDEDLLATCWTTAGDAAPLRGDERSPIPLPDRVAAEREYGISGIRSLLEDNGIVHLELELLTDWWTDGPPRRDSDKVRRDLLSAAEALGARHIKVGPDVTDAPWGHDRWVSEFAALAAEAQEAGTKVGLEFLPWSNIKTVH